MNSSSNNSQNNPFDVSYDPSADIEASNSYYQQLTGKTRGLLGNEINTRNTGYGIQANEAQNQLGIASRDLTNAEGEKGTWGSSARNIRMNSLANTYGNTLSNLYNTTQGANTASLITGEYDLGSNNLPNSNINKYNVNYNPGSSYGASGATTNASAPVKYNPFGGYGQLEANRIGYNRYLQGQKKTITNQNQRI